MVVQSTPSLKIRDPFLNFETLPANSGVFRESVMSSAAFGTPNDAIWSVSADLWSLCWHSCSI